MLPYLLVRNKTYYHASTHSPLWIYIVCRLQDIGFGDYGMETFSILLRWNLLGSLSEH